MKIAMRILVVAGVVSLLAAGAMAQRPNLITWRTDFNTDPTWQNDTSIYPDVGLTSGFWGHRNNYLGQYVPWTAAQFAAYCQSNPFTGNDSAVDLLLDDNGMVWNGDWDPVFDTQPDDGYKSDVVYNFGMQKGTNMGSFSWVPVAYRQVVGGPIEGGNLVTTQAGCFFLDVKDDGAGGQKVTFGTTNFGGANNPSLAYTILNGNAVVDLENKGGDGKLINYATWPGHLTNDAARDDGALLATGLSNDIVEITLSIDPFTTYTVTEIADHRSDFAGTETMTVNYMMVSYTIDDCDGVADAIMGEVGLAVTPWIHSNPAGHGTGYGGGIWDYAFIDLMAPKGDANGDGVVNDADLSLLLTGWGGPGTWGTGDFSGDGVKSDPDLSLLLSKWALNCGDNSDHPALVTYFIPNCTNPDAVPEPATLALLGLGALALVRRRR